VAFWAYAEDCLKQYSLQPVSRIAQSEETSFTKFEPAIWRDAARNMECAN
jgi:hypothetical protein